MISSVVPGTIGTPLLSSLGSTRSHEQLKALGINAGLSKPTRPARLHNALLLALNKIGISEEKSNETGRAWSEELSILLVEDNPVNRMVAERVLGRLGFAVDSAIDGSGGFYRNPVAPECRSWMNVPFILPNEDLNKPFLAEAAKAGLVNLEGHRSVGGMRASIYNAFPEQGIDVLIQVLRDFEAQHA